MNPKQRRQVLSLLLLLPLIFGFLAVYHGQDNSWDLRNYHYYNAYALDTDRLDRDIHMAQVQSYLNPALDMVFYQLIQTFTPRTATFILGYIQGINASLLLLISLLIVRPILAPGARIIGAVVVTTAGCYAPTIISQMGTASNDITTSVFVLASILLILHLKSLPEINAPNGRLLLISAGILLGMGIGLKLTLLIYAIAMIAALLFSDGGWKTRVEGLIVASTGLLIGLLITRGLWMWYLWQNFGSPLFPFYNQIFESPFYLIQNFADVRFLPKSLAHHLVFPFIRGFLNGYTEVQKNHLDLRYGIIYALLAISLAIRLLKNGPRNVEDRASFRWKDHERFLLVFFIAAYLVWQFKFAIWRYANPLEQLGPAVIIILIRSFPFGEVGRRSIIALAFVVTALGVSAPVSNRLAFKASFFRIQVPELDKPEETVIIVAGGRPWAYLASAFPPSVRFIRISSNMITPGDTTQLVQKIRATLAAHNGPTYLLSRRRYLAGHLKELVAYGLTYSANQASPIYSEHEPPGLLLLPIRRK